MSGSTIGGVVGGVIGFYVGGAQGAQVGWMIGSAVGGYVDPDVLTGPRLNDAQTQTSMEGAPRSIVYGTAVVAGNVIQSGPLVEHKHRERTGKGGPVQESFVYTRSYAIRVCEGPVGGISRIWRDDKLVYDVRDPADPEMTIEQRALVTLMGAETTKFASQCVVYLGDETQLPDPTLEALPAANGGGMGNVPAYRGTCYVVIANDDLTNRQGSIPQYRFEVVSAGTTASGTFPTPIVGEQTHDVTLPGSNGDAYIAEDEGAVRWWSDPVGQSFLASGADIETGLYTNAMSLLPGLQWTNAGDSPGDSAIRHRGSKVFGYYTKETWSVGADANYGYCQLFNNGGFVADLRPTLGTPTTWWYAEGTFFPEYGGLVWFTGSDVIIGVRQTGNGGGTVYNKIFKWPLEDAAGAIVAATQTSATVTAGSYFYLHCDRSNQLRSLSLTEAELIAYDSDLNRTSVTTLTMPLDDLYGFGVDAGRLFLLRSNAPAAGRSLYIYDMASQTLQQTVALSGLFANVGHQIIFTAASIFIRSGVYLKRIAYQPYCLISPPPGWVALPDSPGYITDGASVMPLCSVTTTVVSDGSAILSDIVIDLCDRVGVPASRLDVSQLTDEVRGFVVGRQLPAGDACRSLQQGYFFDLPEWGNYTDTTTKLRGIKRGGASMFAITDDDLVESDGDEDTRAQAVEFPRKINLITADVSADYNPTKQTAERRTENIKAVGEATVELPLALTRDEAAAKADIMLKVAWSEAEGRWVRELPEEFSALVPSDCFTHGGKRWRAEKCEYGDGSNKVEAVRDRANAYTSAATSGDALTPTAPTSTNRGPTILAAMNLPSLRSADNVPGMYVAVCGLLDGWIGCDLQISVDAGASYQTVARITSESTMGSLVADCDSGATDLITVSILHGHEIETVTPAQLASRANAFAIVTGSEAEIGQFQTATETATAGIYDLTDLARGELATVAAAHSQGNRFVLLDGNVTFVPIDVSHAGETIIFRPVSIGTAAANNATYSVVYDPDTEIIHDGGEIT